MVGVVGAEPVRGGTTEVASILGLDTGNLFSLDGLGAFKGGAAGRSVTLLAVVDVEFILTSFSGCFGEPSSALRLTPFSGEGPTGTPCRDAGLLTAEGGRDAFALAGLANAFGGGGAGDWSLPIELRMSLKRLILCATTGESEGYERVREELGRSRFYACEACLHCLSIAITARRLTYGW